MSVPHNRTWFDHIRNCPEPYCVRQRQRRINRIILWVLGL